MIDEMRGDVSEENETGRHSQVAAQRLGDKRESTCSRLGSRRLIDPSTPSPLRGAVHTSPWGRSTTGYATAVGIGKQGSYPSTSSLARRPPYGEV